MPKAVHQAADRAAFLGHRDEQLAGTAVVEQADGDVALVAGDAELVGDRLAACRAAARGAACRGRFLGLGLVGLGARVERLAFLRAVAIDGQRLEAQLPAVDVRLGDVLGRRVRAAC